MLMPIFAPLAETPRIAVNIVQLSQASATTNTRTVVQKFTAGAITQYGSKVRIKFRSSNSGNATMTDVFIGESATTGSAYNFNTGTATRITFGGANGITLIAGQEMESDLVPFTLASGKAYSVAMNWATAAQTRYASSLGTNYVQYYRTSSADASSETKSGTYTNGGARVDLITKIIVV